MADLAQVASNLIAQFGRSATLRVTTRVEGDSAKPWGSSGDTETTADYKVTAVFMDLQQQDVQNRQSTAGRLVTDPVAIGTQQVLIAAKGIKIAPTIEMTLIDGAQEYEITRVTLTKPGSTSYLYTLEVTS